MFRCLSLAVSLAGHCVRRSGVGVFWSRDWSTFCNFVSLYLLNSNISTTYGVNAPPIRRLRAGILISKNTLA